MKIAAVAVATALIAIVTQANAGKCVDSEECGAVIPGLLLTQTLASACGRTLFGRQVSSLCPASCEVCSKVTGRRSSDRTPKIITDKGDLKISVPTGQNVLIERPEGVVDLTDAMTHTEAEAAFGEHGKDIANVQRRAEATECDVATLVEQLADNVAQQSVKDDARQTTAAEAAQSRSDALVNAIQAFNDNYVKLNEVKNEGASDKKTGGLAWDPLAITPVLADLGGQGSAVTVTFPPGRELVAHPDIKVYQCVFTELTSDGKLTKTTRTSDLVAAATPRAIKCPTPVWGKGGKLGKAEWKTAMTVLENGREMPSPDPAPVFTWKPNAPEFSVPLGEILVEGPPGEKENFEQAIQVVYPYGQDGYKDLTFSVDTDQGDFVSNVGIIGASSSAEKTLRFSVKATAAFSFTITVTATSTLSELSGSSVVSFKWEPRTGLGKDGTTSDWMTKEAVKAIHERVGRGGSKWELCYSYKLHGSSANTMHDRCDGKGPLLVAMRRSNGRVFGGYMHISGERNGGYRYSGLISPRSAGPWLWRVNPNDPKKVDFLDQINRHGSHQYYRSNSYHYTWGGGHDLTCYSDMTYCYANIGHNYYDGGYGYHTSQSRPYLTGDYQWNHRSENGDYEVYLCKE